MINVLFWNTHRNKEINSVICEITEEKKCDIIILAEYNSEPEGLGNELSLIDRDFAVIPQIACDKIVILADRSFEFDTISDGKRYRIEEFSRFGQRFLCVSLHLPDKQNSGDDEQVILSQSIIRSLEDAEKREGHENSFIIGDFNANPFEPACINANAFHSVSSRREADKIKRTVNGEEYKMFYNPMWNFFGDWDKIGGTHYYNSSKIKNYSWNILDQVMFRPNTMKNVYMKSIEIITEVQGKTLLNRNGIPNKKDYSDHLPIFFSIREEYDDEQFMGKKAY